MLQPGTSGVVSDAITAVPGAKHWSYGSFEFDPRHRTPDRAARPRRRDDRRVHDPGIRQRAESDLGEIARIVIAACEPWENRQGVGG